jgi:carbohydrate-selective porin OprB
MIRAIALLLIVAFAAAAPASAQQHWLQGKWTGALTNQPMNSRTGP